MICKKIKKIGSGITLTNTEIKDIMKVIKSLKRRGILLIGTTRKVTRQEGGFLNFLRPLMTVGLPFMKSVLTPLAKRIVSRNVCIRCSYSKEYLWIRYNSINNFK